jgi:hypothetical protein
MATKTTKALAKTAKKILITGETKKTRKQEAIIDE